DRDRRRGRCALEVARLAVPPGAAALIADRRRADRDAAREVRSHHVAVEGGVSGAGQRDDAALAPPFADESLGHLALAVDRVEALLLDRRTEGGGRAEDHAASGSGRRRSATAPASGKTAASANASRHELASTSAAKPSGTSATPTPRTVCWNPSAAPLLARPA